MNDVGQSTQPGRGLPCRGDYRHSADLHIHPSADEHKTTSAAHAITATQTLAEGNGNTKDHIHSTEEDPPRRATVYPGGPRRSGGEGGPEGPPIGPQCLSRRPLGELVEQIVYWVGLLCGLFLPA